MGFLNRTGAEKVINFIRKMQKNHFLLLNKIKKYRKCPALETLDRAKFCRQCVATTEAAVSPELGTCGIFLIF